MMPNSKPVFKSEVGRKAILAEYDAILQQSPVPCETFSVPTRYGNTFVIASGEKTAPPLILLHGSTSNSIVWLGDIAEYRRHYRVYALDLPGEPGKSDPVRPELQSPAYVEWLDDIFLGLGLTSAHLLGISLGGWLALKYTIARPEKVTKLILLCPSGVGPAKITFLLRSVVYLSCGDWGIKRMNKVLYGKQNVPREAVDFINLLIKNFNPRIEQIPIFSDEELQKLTMPVLVIVGALDVVLDSQKTASRFRSVLPDKEVVLLENTGHVIIDVSERIMAFLNKSN